MMKSFTKSIRKVKVGTKIVSFVLALLVVFYVMPSTVFAEESYAGVGGEVGSDTAGAVAADGAASFLSSGVLYEDESLRSENVKHFHLEDGSYIAANYGSPVHTLDEEGKWQDIDNTLDTAWGVASTPDARIKFDKKIGGSGSLFTLHEGNTKIKMSLVGAIKKTPGEVTNYEDSEEDTKLQKMMNLEKLTSKIYYSDILSGVDLEYIVTSGDIKENIIVKERGSSYSYTFEISLNNLTAALNESGDVEILCGDGETKYTIPAPVVYDASGVYADGGV